MLTASEDKVQIWQIVLCTERGTLFELDDSTFWRNAICLRMDEQSLVTNVGHCLIWMHVDRIPVGQIVVIVARPLGQPDATIMLKAERATSGLLMTHHGRVKSDERRSGN